MKVVQVVGVASLDSKVGVVVHIGYPRAGSSWLQAILAKNPSISQPVSRTTIIDGLVLDSSRDALAEIRNRLVDSVRSGKSVISCERLIGSIHSGGSDRAEVLARLAEVVAGLDPTIVVVLRKQQVLALSAYERYLQVGGAAPVGVYFDQGKGHARIPGFRWNFVYFDKILEELVSVFGKSAVRPVIFEKMTADPVGTLKSIGIASQDLDVFPNPSNTAPALRSTAMHRTANALFAKGRLSPGAPIRSERLLSLMQLLNTTHSGSAVNRWRRARLLAEVEQLAPMAEIRHSNREVERTYGLGLSTFGYAI